MRVILLESLANPTHCYLPGEVLDLSEADASRLVERGLAELEAQPVQPAKAAPVKTTPENPEKTQKRSKREER